MPATQLRTQDSGPLVPRHVAVIMDGNGRWAQARGLPRHEGHRRGLDALRRTVKAAGDLGLEVLTVYSFSTENWRRPRAEVSFLLGLLRRFVENDLAELHDANVRVRMIGGREGLAQDILALIEKAEALTAGNTKLTLVIAFNYGSRDELVRVARQIAVQAAAGTLSADTIDEDFLSARMDTDGLPDPDLVIRTSGEMRISNFLLWQAAYAEFIVTPTLWPDFDKAALEEAITEFHARDRRFGGLTAQAG
ncbi:MAG: isoprenyl transferase [Bosea sp. (in: a-proteobacteria)]